MIVDGSRIDLYGLNTYPDHEILVKQNYTALDGQLLVWKYSRSKDSTVHALNLLRYPRILFTNHQSHRTKNPDIPWINVKLTQELEMVDNSVKLRFNNTTRVNQKMIHEAIHSTNQI